LESPGENRSLTRSTRTFLCLFGEYTDMIREAWLRFSGRDRAVSPVVGEILMVMLVVVLASVRLVSVTDLVTGRIEMMNRMLDFLGR
jgi:flagellin-like protein